MFKTFRTPIAILSLALGTGLNAAPQQQPDGNKGVIGQLKTFEELKASFKPGEWNQFHLIARGNTLIHIVNGLVTAVCVDDDLKGRSMAGLIGFQLHGGPPMKLELRNPAIKLK